MKTYKGPNGKTYSQAEWDAIAHFDMDGNPVSWQEVKPAGSSVEVVRYKSSVEFERDANRRHAEGWTLQGQSQETGQTHRIRRGINGLLVGGLFGFPRIGGALGALSGRRDEGMITATWVRG